MLALGSSALAMQMARPLLHAAFLYPASSRMQPPRAAQMKAYDERPPSHIVEGQEELCNFWECPSEEYQISAPADIFQHTPRRPAGRWWKLFSHDDEFEELEPPPRKSDQGAAPAEVDSDLPAHAPKRRFFWASRVRAPSGGKGAKEEPAPRRHAGRGGRVTAMEGIGGPAHRHAAADAEALQAEARAAEAAAVSAVEAAEAAAEVAQEAAFAAQRARVAARLALESDGEYVTW